MNINKSIFEELFLAGDTQCVERDLSFSLSCLARSKIKNKEPITGQEAVCPDGLGRVSTFSVNSQGINSITVETYINNRSCEWSPDNVKLVAIKLEE